MECEYLAKGQGEGGIAPFTKYRVTQEADVYFGQGGVEPEVSVLCGGIGRAAVCSAWNAV